MIEALAATPHITRREDYRAPDWLVLLLSLIHI